MLKETTRQLILEIASFPIFENAGKKESKVFGTPCKSWEDAVRFARTPQWENICQTFSNRLTVKCNAARLPRDRSWNTMVDEVNDLLSPAMAKINIFFSEKNEAWSLGGHSIFQIRSAVEEVEYSDVVAPHFFYPVLLPIYRAGYYPCGWNGNSIPRQQLGGEVDELPKGKPRVF